MPLADQIRAMERGDHVCLIYDTFEAQLAATLPFIRAGLEAGDRCVYFCDEHSIEEVEESLRGYGIDVAREIGKGALVLVTSRDAYLATGEFDPHAMIDLLRELETKALREGHRGLRVTGEMTWMLQPGSDPERALEYEALLSHYFPNSHSRAICQYNRERFEPAILERVLQTHPVAMVGDRMVDNIYYEPPEVFFERNVTRARVDWKLSQLWRSMEQQRRLHASEVSDAEQRYRTTALVAAQKRTLELMVSGAPLRAVLRELVLAVEEHSGGDVVASILLLDDDCRLRNGASPSLPEDYLQAIDGLPADPALGTCCAAAATAQVVVTPDFATAPGWHGISHLPLALGLRGAWSMPIIARDGSVLGTFGTYFRECREPGAAEREIVEVLARTASIAIERGRAEEALRERDAFNRRLLDSSGDCIKVLDADGRLLSMNRAGQELMGIDDIDSEIGASWIDYWDGVDREAAERAVFAARSGREGRFRGVSTTRRGDRRCWDVLVTGIPGESGAPVQLLAISRDVTQQQAAEDELREATRKAEAASEAKSQFLAVMSHELRTPLTGIIGYSDLLASDVWGVTNDQQKQHIARIKSGAWHLVSIIDEILTFSRMEAGKEDVVLERVDFATCVRESAELLQPAAAAKRIDLRLQTQAEPVFMDTDAGKLRQIVLNLLGNAIKFTDEGYVELRVSVDEGAATLRIADTGPGIGADAAERIFDAFVQADQSNTRSKGGTGLGLTVCRNLAELLGGTVRLVESREGAGSTFELRLPLSAPVAA